MRNNDDPIQDLTPFRIGLDNIAENDEINAKYSEYKDDLHDCSDDLSNEGSIREEIAHAQFARKKREEMLENTDRYALKNANTNKKATNSISKTIIIFIIVFLWMVINVMIEISSMFGDISKDIINNNDLNNDLGTYEDYNNYDETDYDFVTYEDYNNYDEADTEIIEDDITYEDQIKNADQDFQNAKNNIFIETTITPEYDMILEIFNNNDKMLSNVKIQLIFYDGEDKPIKICDGFSNALFANGRNIVKIMDMPDMYERFDILISQSYVSDTIDIDISQLELYATQNEEGDFNIELTNNSEYKLDVVSTALIYYKNNKIIDVEEDSIYDIKSGRTEREEIYNFHYNNDYDRIELIINDVRIEQ